jgi:hypothetical protein
MASCTEEKIHAALFIPRSRQIVVEGLEIADCAPPTRSTYLVIQLERSYPAADASRGMNGAVIVGSIIAML